MQLHDVSNPNPAVSNPMPKRPCRPRATLLNNHQLHRYSHSMTPTHALKPSLYSSNSVTQWFFKYIYLSILLVTQSTKAMKHIKDWDFLHWVLTQTTRMSSGIAGDDNFSKYVLRDWCCAAIGPQHKQAATVPSLKSMVVPFSMNEKTGTMYFLIMQNLSTWGTWAATAVYESPCFQWNKAFYEIWWTGYLLKIKGW